MRSASILPIAEETTSRTGAGALTPGGTTTVPPCVALVSISVFAGLARNARYVASAGSCAGCQAVEQGLVVDLLTAELQSGEVELPPFDCFRLTSDRHAMDLRGHWHVRSCACVRIPAATERLCRRYAETRYELRPLPVSLAEARRLRSPPGLACGPWPRQQWKETGGRSIGSPDRKDAAMRVVWRGTISFGLVTIPVRLYVATESKNVPSHQIHISDGGRVQYKRVCSIDGAEVPLRGDRCGATSRQPGELVGAQRC